MNICKHISDLIEKYDEAVFEGGRTVGETASYWKSQEAAIEDNIKNILDDLGPVECARHMIFSPAL